MTFGCLTGRIEHGTFLLLSKSMANAPEPIRVKEVMPMSSHGTEGITVEAVRR
jgi:hypothetical protein